MRPHPFVAGCLGLLLALCAGAAAAAQAHAVVLQYQRIGAEDAARLQRQLRHLRDEGYTVLPLPELIRRLRAGEPLPDRSVAISFDGAERSVCTTASALLGRFGMPFTVFVDTDAVDRNLPTHCSWDELRRLGAGGVALANGTRSGGHLAHRAAGQGDDDWRAQVLAEIDGAERRIAAETGQSHRLLAWPHGEFGDALKQIAHAAGYTAFGRQPGPLGPASDWLELPRFAQADTAGMRANLPAFAAELESLPFPLAAVHRPRNPLRSGAGTPSLEVVLRPREPGARLARAKLQCFSSDGRRIGSNWLSETRFRVKAYRPLPPGLSRYDCVLPAGGGRLYWYSQVWLTLE